MGFPWTFEENFESGTRGNFDAASATAPTFPHYTEVARSGMAPYRGAYCMRRIAAGNTTSSFVREDTAMDQAASGSLFVRLYFYLGKDLLMADGDKFSLIEGESTLDTTTEYAAGIDRSGANIRVWFAETQAAATVRTFVLGTTATALGRWYHLELNPVIDSGAPNDGTLDGWIDDASIGAQITGLDQVAIVNVKIGVIGPDAGTTGTVLIDDVIADDVRIYKDREQYRTQNGWIYSDDDHPIIGSGKFALAITGTGTNVVASLYDTDSVPNRLDPFAIIRNVTANEFVPGHDIFDVTHGLYITLSGTNAQAFISIDRTTCVSDATVINRGLRLGTFRP